jgi:hypothetical protein
MNIILRESHMNAIIKIVVLIEMLAAWRAMWVEEGENGGFGGECVGAGLRVVGGKTPPA